MSTLPAQAAKVVRIDRTSADVTSPDQGSSESRSVFDPPKMPKFLKGEARKHWKELVDNLMKHKIINELDADILAMYCQSYARWLDADNQVDEDGLTQQTPNGYVALSSAYVVWRDLTSQCLKLARQLGLTPPARFQLKTGAPEGQGSLDLL